MLRTVPFPVPPPSLNDLYDRIERAITPRTRVIMIGIETLVDGAHGFAHFPFRRDDLECDYYGTNSRSKRNDDVRAARSAMS